MNTPSSLVEQCLKVCLKTYGLNHVEDIINNFATDLRDKYKSLFDEFGPIAQKRYDFSRKICRVVFDNDGHIFGGYVRDTLYGNWFKDMDIEFNFTKESYKKFDNDLCRIGNVTQIVGENYKSQLIKLRVTDTRDPDHISIDLDIVNASFFNWGIDFDVNALETSYFVEKKPLWQLSIWGMDHICQLKGLFIKSVYGYEIEPILNHIKNREFVVLAANREPLVSHTPYAPKPVFSKKGRIIHIISDKYQKQVCIERNWLGLKILDRMTKMKRRGWTCINDQCPNPACILSCPSTWAAYDKYRHLQFNIRFYNQLLEEKRTQWEILTESLNVIPLKYGNQTSIYHSKRMCESGKKSKKKYPTSTAHPKKDPKWTRSKIEV